MTYKYPNPLTYGRSKREQGLATTRRNVKLRKYRLTTEGGVTSPSTILGFKMERYISDSDRQTIITSIPFNLENELNKDKNYRKLMLCWAFGLGVSLTIFFGGLISLLFPLI